MPRLRSPIPPVILAALSLAMASPAGAATKWALLVGIDQYQSSDITPLQYSVADVKAVAKGLVDYAGFPADNVAVMTSDLERTDPQYPTSIRVLRRLNILANHIGADDTFFFYFSGHGFQKGEGHHYLGTADAELGDEEILQQSTLPLERLKEKMKNIQARHVIFVLDACRNDPEKARGGGANVQTSSFSRDLKQVADSSGAGAEGSAILFACAEGQRSWEWPEKGHGAFTYYFLDGLQRAAEPGGQITINSLAEYIQVRMKEWGKDHDREQTPDLETGGAAKIVLVDHRSSPDVQPVDTVAHVTLTTDPAGAKVFIDGEEQPGKVTPCTVDIDLGVQKNRDVVIGVLLDGYKQVTRRARIGWGATLPLDFPLERLPLPPRPSPPEPGPPVPPGPNGSQARINPKDNAEMVYIPAGEFLMGSADTDTNALKDEKPQHRVYLDGYWIYKNVVTVAQYQKFCTDTNRQMPTEPDWGRKEDHPIVNVSWNNAVAYCQWAGTRLPTEAEWEKAARGTRATIYPWGDQSDDSRLWCNKPAGTGTAAVGSHPSGASPYGVLDTAGNVWQWCADWYDENTYRNSDLVAHNPAGPGSGNYRVLRGGSWSFTPVSCRSAVRFRLFPGIQADDNGFRCAGSGQ